MKIAFLVLYCLFAILIAVISGFIMKGHTKDYSLVGTSIIFGLIWPLVAFCLIKDFIRRKYIKKSLEETI